MGQAKTVALVKWLKGNCERENKHVTFFNATGLDFLATTTNYIVRNKQTSEKELKELIQKNVDNEIFDVLPSNVEKTKQSLSLSKDIMVNLPMARDLVTVVSSWQ